MKTAALTPWERTPEADDKDPRHVLRRRAFAARQERVWDTRGHFEGTSTGDRGLRKAPVDIEASRVKIPTCKPGMWGTQTIRTVQARGTQNHTLDAQKSAWSF
jgi:hypothetical protein